MSKIPRISDEELKKLAETIKPLVQDKGNLYIENVYPRSAFNIEPKLTERADLIEPYKNITTFHTYGRPSDFRPSIKEVIEQIPKEDLEKCIAFETKRIGFTKNLEYHSAITTLYKSKL